MMVAIALTAVFFSGGLTLFSAPGLVIVFVSSIAHVFLGKYVRANVTPAEKDRVAFLEYALFSAAGICIPFLSFVYAVGPYLH